jgi:hypothetical protein
MAMTAAIKTHSQSIGLRIESSLMASLIWRMRDTWTTPIDMQA